MELYPLLMTPYFRHGAETPWGGSMLSDVFLKDAPDERTRRKPGNLRVAGL